MAEKSLIMIPGCNVQRHLVLSLAVAMYLAPLKLPNYPDSSQFVLSDQASTNDAAINLFAALRLADVQAKSLILAEYVPEEGLGRAINDRLKRAAVK